jgi:hypothetical protein
LANSKEFDFVIDGSPLPGDDSIILQELAMKGQKIVVWIAVGIGVGVAIGASTHAIAVWICVGVVAGAVIGAAVARR